MPTPAITSRLPQVGTTIFTTMSALAVEHDAINLGQGFPNFNCDPALTEAVAHAMQAGHNQYPPRAGVRALREVVSGKTEALYGHHYDVDAEVTITAGVMPYSTFSQSPVTKPPHGPMAVRAKE